MPAHSISNTASATVADRLLASAGSSWLPDNSSSPQQQQQQQQQRQAVTPPIGGSGSGVITPGDQSSCHLDDTAHEVDGWLVDDDSTRPSAGASAAAAVVPNHRLRASCATTDNIQLTNHIRPSGCELDALINCFKVGAQPGSAELQDAQLLRLQQAAGNNLRGLLHYHQQQQQQQHMVAAAATGLPAAASAAAAAAGGAAGVSCASATNREDLVIARHLAQLQLMFAQRQHLSKAWKVADAAAQGAMQQQVLAQQLQLQELRQQSVERQQIALTVVADEGMSN